MKYDRQAGEWAVPSHLCSFGITEAITAALISVGVGEATAAIAAPALLGAGTGAAGGGAIAGIEGKPILPGVLEGGVTGGITGGAIGNLGPLLGAELGGGSLATGVGDVIAGAGGGALGSAITGQNVGTGALAGGASGALSGVLSAATGGGTAPGSTTGGPGASASGTAAAASAAPAASSAITGGESNVLGPGQPTPAGPTTFGTASSSPSNRLWDSVFGGSLPSASAIEAAPVGAGGIISAPSATGAGDTWNVLTPSQAAAATGAAGSGGGLGGLAKYAPLAALAPVGLDLLKGQQALPGENALKAQASQLASQGTQLESYLQSGTLPPGVSQSLRQAADSAKAAIRSKYAQSGGNSSAMEQDLASVDTIAATQGATIAQQLLSQGVSETGLANNIYSALMAQATQQDAALSQALGGFATSLAGGSRPIVLQAGATP